MTALARLAATADPALAPYAVPDPGAGELEAIAGEEERAFVLEAIREGYLLHYHAPRAFAAGMDDDLRLLGGDSLFALGLERLAAAGDLAAVAELSGLISDSARAEAEGTPEAVAERWRASAERLAAAAGTGSAEGRRAASE